MAKSDRTPLEDLPPARSPAAFIGAVVATDERAAIKAAIEEFGIDDPAQQKRLLAQRD